MNYLIKISMILMVGLLAYSCGDDEEDPVVTPDLCDGITATYNGDVQGIINNSCAYFGCHNGSNGNIDDYSTFEGMAAVIADGKINTRVLVNMNMPNPDITPDDRPQSLTEDELQIMQCWHDAGYPEG